MSTFMGVSLAILGGLIFLSWGVIDHFGKLPNPMGWIVVVVAWVAATLYFERDTIGWERSNAEAICRSDASHQGCDTILAAWRQRQDEEDKARRQVRFATDQADIDRYLKLKGQQ